LFKRYKLYGKWNLLAFMISDMKQIAAETTPIIGL